MQRAYLLFEPTPPASKLADDLSDLLVQRFLRWWVQRRRGSTSIADVVRVKEAHEGLS